MDSTFNAVFDHIDWAFGDLSAYYEARTRRDLLEGTPHFDEVARSYVAITRLASHGHNAPDRRASSIEVALARHVPLQGHAKLAILPKQYLEDGPHFNREILDKLESQGVAWRVYDWQPFSRPIDYQITIAEITRDYLALERYFDA